LIVSSELYHETFPQHSTYMQPQYRTNHITQPQMQTIPIPQINRTHPDSSPPLIPLVILLNLVIPKASDIFRTLLLPKAHIDEEVAEIGAGGEVGSGLVGCGAEFASDAFSKGLDSVPAAKVTRTGGFVVQGCS
jgi:hypothetical protein